MLKTRPKVIVEIFYSDKNKSTLEKSILSASLEYGQK